MSDIKSKRVIMFIADNANSVKIMCFHPATIMSTVNGDVKMVVMLVA